MVASPRLRELLKATAKRLNRKAEESEPYLAILEENWYDSVDSLKLVQVAELQALGIPHRFAKELLQLAQTDGQKVEPSPPPTPPSITVPSPHPPEGPPPRKRPHEDGPDYGKGFASTWKSPRPEEKGSEERKGKGKGKGKAKGGKGDRQDERWDESRNHSRTHGHDQWDQYEKWEDWRGHNHEPPPELASHKSFQLMHKITFQEEIHPDFPLAARLIGKGGRNVKHIHKETGAWVWLCGQGSGFKEKDGREANEPLHIRVQCDSQANLDEAVVQTHDLLDAVLQMYSDWLVSGKLSDEEEAGYGGRGPRAPREAPNTAFKGASKGEREKRFDGDHSQRHWHQKSQKGNRSWEQKDWSKSKW